MPYELAYDRIGIFYTKHLIYSTNGEYGDKSNNCLTVLTVTSLAVLFNDFARRLSHDFR